MFNQEYMWDEWYYVSNIWGSPLTKNWNSEDYYMERYVYSSYKVECFLNRSSGSLNITWGLLKGSISRDLIVWNSVPKSDDLVPWVI